MTFLHIKLGKIDTNDINHREVIHSGACEQHDEFTKQFQISETQVQIMLIYTQNERTRYMYKSTAS